MFAALVLAAALDASVFSDSKPWTVSKSVVHVQDGLHVRDVAFGDVKGTIVEGRGAGKHPAVLFVHWLGDPATTNRSEFEPDAIALAKRGVTSLRIDAMWSAKDWFEKRRSPKTDYRDSIAQVIDLRRALDVLLREPNIDRARVAYVGHDFGAMYGAVLAGVDPRPQWYVLMAGTTSFAQWYLLGEKPDDVAAYTAQMEPLDPPQYLARSKARAFYFQFSGHDRYITPEEELGFFSAAPLPRTMSLYDVDHSLHTPAAAADRLAWLAEKLRL